MSNEYSKRGDFPGDIKTPYHDAKKGESPVRHLPYEEAIKPFAKKAQALYNKAVGSGLLNETTIKHYNELMQKIGL